MPDIVIPDTVKAALEKDPGVELEILDRKIQDADTKDDSLPELITRRRTLRRQLRIKRLQRELEEAQDGSEDGMLGY